MAFLASLLLYAPTMSRGLLWGDSGEAQLHTLLDDWYVDGQIARSHVLYYATARGLRRISGLSAAVAANLTATLFGAVAVANVAALLAGWLRSRAAVACGVLLLMVSHTLWQLSTSAEVVTLTAALLSTEWLLFRACVETGKPSRLAWTALANGLGVSNHNFALLMWPVYGVLAWRWRGACMANRRYAPLLVGAWVAGALPVLALCVDHYARCGSVWETAQSFLVGRYAADVFNVERLPTLLAKTAGAVLLNFPTPLLLLAPLGAAVAVRTLEPPVRWLLIGASLVYTGFAARYDVPDRHTFLVPSYLLLAMWIAGGLERIHLRRPGRFTTAVVWGCSLWSPIVYAAAPPLLRRWAPTWELMPTRTVPYRDRFDWFLRPWRAGENGAERFARETLESLPPDAWLIADSTLYPPLNYLQIVEGLRRDVRVDCVLARQDWMPPPEPGEREARRSAGLLFVSTDDRRYWPSWMRTERIGLERAGLVHRVVDEEDPP